MHAHQLAQAYQLEGDTALPGVHVAQNTSLQVVRSTVRLQEAHCTPRQDNQSCTSAELARTLGEHTVTRDDAGCCFNADL